MSYPENLYELAVLPSSGLTLWNAYPKVNIWVANHAILMNCTQF